MRIRGAVIDAEGQVVSRRRARLVGRKEAAALRKIPMFAACSRAELQLVDRLMCEVRVPAGRVLAREGLPAQQTFVVISGRARISRGGETLGTAEPGACFGGRELRARTVSPVTMTAATPMVVRAAGTREFRSLLDAIPLSELIDAPAMRLAVGESVGYGTHFMHAPHSPVAQSPVAHLSAAPDDTETVADEIEAFLRRHNARESDRVLAAVMFTDIVGSTDHVTALGDGAWHTLLDEHDSIIGNAVWRHGGTMVNFLGDGALARFECANSAVQCALAVRAAVRDLGIDMRAGLHAGEVELRGSDISGIAVHVASRICSVAGSGCVLASRTLVELVAGSGLVFEDAGTHALKGVGGEWPLLAVTG